MNEQVKRIKIVTAYGEIYQIWDDKVSGYWIHAFYRRWCPKNKKWNEGFGINIPGSFPVVGTTVLYDSADPMVGIPNGTEWVHDSNPIVYRVVNGSVWRRQGREAWVDGYNFYINSLLNATSFIRYNPDLSIYTEPEWLVALRAEAAKPCYIAADGRKIPVGSKLVYKPQGKEYADFTLEKSDGSGTWRKRSTGEVDRLMNFLKFEDGLKSIDYRLELSK